MARNWSLEAEYVEYCNCTVGCPCEFMNEPSEGHCTGVVAFRIIKGHCDNVKLDGLTVAATFFFPRAIHHGDGHMQPIIDESATDEQRDALFYILTAQDQPVGTMFQIFSVIIDHHHDPIFAKIDWEWDIDKRRARLEVPGVMRADCEPVRNPVTDKEERSILVLPDGWVFHEAENAAGTAKSLGEIKFDNTKRHSSLAYVAWDINGLQHDLHGARQRFPLS